MAETSRGSFSGLVTSRAWRADVEEWVHDRVLERGHRVTGPLDQRRVCAWSTQLVVPTDVGRLWFKALCPAMAFEPALQELLASVVPLEVDRPYAIHAQRGWMLTVDRGCTLGEEHEATLDDWCAVVATMADIQRAIALHRDAVLATGVSDCSPATVPDRFDGLVELMSELPPEHPSHVDADLRAALHAVRPRLVDVCERLSTSPLPVTLQHGDLHPGNVFAAPGGGAGPRAANRPGGGAGPRAANDPGGGAGPRAAAGRALRVFDFGDTQWAPAVEVLSVPFGVLNEEGRLPWRPVLESYAERWSDVVDVRSLTTLWEAASFTQPVNRAQTWWGALADATGAELADWGIAPRHHLVRVLDA